MPEPTYPIDGPSRNLKVPSLLLPDLRSALVTKVSQIPEGHISTFRRVANAVGDFAATRWVADEARVAELGTVIPWHRLVHESGLLGQNQPQRVRAQAELLLAEGSLGDRQLDDLLQGEVDPAQTPFDSFVGPRPLAQLSQQQEQLGHSLQLKPLDCPPRLVGGLDISYATNAGQTNVVAAYTLCHWPHPEVIWSLTEQAVVEFPYITGYLSYRELPVYLNLLRRVWSADRGCDLLMVDGSGILHPRLAGVATHLGILLNLPTVGVSKKRLCGELDLNGLETNQARQVTYQGQIRGVALRPNRASKRPLFVSPGHLCDVPSAEECVRQMLSDHRLPEPIFWADRLSREQLQVVG